MTHLLTRLAVGLTTFLVGVCAATLPSNGPRPAASGVSSPVPFVWKAEPRASPAVDEFCARLWGDKGIGDEEKAVLAAQGFVALAGYTDGTAGMADWASSCVEAPEASEESYRLRYDTLERRAYGLSRLRGGGDKGWTVVFRYRQRAVPHRLKLGRAVTMDEDFRNLRVEHCDFSLDRVEKKL